MATSDDISSSGCNRMGDRLTIGQLIKWLVGILEPPDDVGQTCGGPEVLLLQTQFFTD